MEPITVFVALYAMVGVVFAWAVSNNDEEAMSLFNERPVFLIILSIVMWPLILAAALFDRSK